MSKLFEIEPVVVGVLALFCGMIFFTHSTPVYGAMGSALSQSDQDSSQKKRALHQKKSPSKQPNTQAAGNFPSEIADAIAKFSQKLQQTPTTGTIDRDFAELITTHNQGAIDMAELELKYGKDPEMLQMARRIIDGQKADNKVIRDWAEKHRIPHPHIDAKK